MTFLPKRISSLVLPPGKAELRTQGAQQELWYGAEQFGAFNGRSGWLLDSSFTRKDIRGVKLWRKALQEWYGIKPALASERTKAPRVTRPRLERKSPGVQPASPTGTTLLEALRKKEVPQGGIRDPDSVWVLYEDLEHALSRFGLTLRSALYHDMLRIVDKRIGQPRMGDDWDGYRVLKVDILKEPPTKQGGALNRAQMARRIVARHLRQAGPLRWKRTEPGHYIAEVLGSYADSPTPVKLRLEVYKHDSQQGWGASVSTPELGSHDEGFIEDSFTENTKREAVEWLLHGLKIVGSKPQKPLPKDEVFSALQTIRPGFQEFLLHGKRDSRTFVLVRVDVEDGTAVLREGKNAMLYYSHPQVAKRRVEDLKRGRNVLVGIHDITRL